MPSEVESPRWATEVHEVFSGPFRRSADSGAVEDFAPGATLAWLTELVEAPRAPDSAPTAAALEATGTATRPASPAQATMTTPVPPAAAASRDAPRLAR